MTLSDVAQPPLLDQGILVLLEESGTVLGLRASTGEEIWRRTLGSPPAQAPYASALGILVSTHDGSAYALAHSDGKPRRLSSATGSLTLTVPHGNGALLVGGGKDGLRHVGPEEDVTVLGDASPLSSSGVWVGARGVAWVDATGVHWLPSGGKRGDNEIVPALGRAPLWVVGDGQTLLTVDASGVVRAADPEEPDELLWQTSVGGRPEASPVLTSNGLFILVNGGVVAVER
jgi:hypothetical protein